MITADLRGKVLLVTGGASGIGFAAATLFARCGAAVAVNDLEAGSEGRPKLSEAVAALRGDRHEAAAVPGDVGDPASVDGIVARTVGTFGRIDYLINNAATPATREPIPFEDLESLSEELWQTILNVNLIGPFRMTRAAAPHLRAVGGAVVNTASTAGLGGQASSLAYAAGKAGLVNMTRNLARGLAPEVRVNAVAPGLVDTPWTRPWPQSRKDGSIANTWLRRAARPEEIAEAMLFLCAGASFMTGQTIIIDGGRL